MVSDHLTLRPQAAPAHTGVGAGGGEAGELRGTVGADNTLRPAGGGGSVVARGAGADTGVALHPVGAVRPTEVVTTRVSQCWGLYRLNF